MRTLHKFAAALALLGASAGLAHAERTRDVIVYSMVTEAGKAMTPPTADHPATCLLIAGGYHEEGDKAAGEKSPPPEKIEQMVRNALAAAHYHGANSKALGVFNGTPGGNFPANYDPAKSDSQTIDYIIAYNWGYMNPETMDMGDDPTDKSNQIVFNKPMMLVLVAGASLDKMEPGVPPWDDIAQAADTDRYFIVISAYSPAAFIKRHEKKLLWRAQMSLDSDGTSQVESMPALVSASVPYLGRETDIPQQINESLDRPSQVIIAAPKVKEYLPAVPAQKDK
ncbi:MAG TPA: hypothetical protein VK717_03390 [Opitutaceae bacterium]|jgi:hypothetical protein|nr:hypothetical protein [Opitutaceae bacterium]